MRFCGTDPFMLWRNPTPDIPVDSIDCIAVKGHPFLLGITVE